MVVFLDSGTTTLAVAHALGGLRDLTVCTTGLAIALHMCRQPQVRVHMLGGEIDPAEEAAVGLDALEAIGRFRVDIAFLGGEDFLLTARLPTSPATAPSSARA